MDSERYVLEVGAELVKLDRVIAGPDDGASEQAVTEALRLKAALPLAEFGPVHCSRLWFAPAAYNSAGSSTFDSNDNGDSGGITLGSPCKKRSNWSCELSK